MAGDWIKVELATPDKPEIIKIATILNVDQDSVFGKCLRFWIWANQQTKNGRALSVTEAFIDRLVACAGFAKALQNVGWLSGENGAFSIPNFKTHNGKPAKTRALARQRMSQKRCASSATKSSPEKRREEKRIIETPLPPFLETDAFKAAWVKWEEFRSQAKLKKCTEIGKTAQWKKLAEIGSERAVKAIENSIAQGYQGIYEAKESVNGNGHAGNCFRSGGQSQLGKVRSGGGEYDNLPDLGKAADAAQRASPIP